MDGSTIAVLGCGVDVIFPPQNKEIYRKIIKSGGAVISEYSLGTPPASERFRQRNRIVSGLSLGVLVVEAEFRSGTTITARYAKEQGKDLFCIPSSRDNNKGIGTNIMIKKGAKLVLNPDDILENYGNYNSKQITIEDLEENIVNEVKIENIKKEYRSIYEVLYSEALCINDISLKTGIEITELYSKLFMMELEGIIKQEKNKYVVS